MKKYIVTSITLLFLISIVFAQSEANKKNPKAWTVDDVLRMESAGSFNISPDGLKVLWTKSKMDKSENRSISNIFLSSLFEDNTVQMTRGNYGARSPKWSPDNKQFAFITSREKGKPSQIWLMNASGGEPFKLTSMEKGINSFQWLNKDYIIFTSREKTSLLEKQLKDKKDDVIVVSDQDHYYPVSLYKINLKTKKVERLSTNYGRIGEFSVSPDGQWIITNENQSVDYSYDYKIPPKQFLYNLKTGKREEIFTEEHNNPRGFSWSLDSKGFYCSRSFSGDPTETYVSISTLYYFNLEKKHLTEVPLDWENRLGRGYGITKNGIFVSLANGVRYKFAFYNKQGDNWKREWLEDEHAENINSFTIAKDGETIIFSHSTAERPPKYLAGKIKKNKIDKQFEFIKINKWIKNKNIAKREILKWKGARGDEVEGILYYPHDFENSKKYPLIPMIHGGPAGADIDAFGEYWARYPNLLATKGFFVLRVNYHGSSNYGLKWVESIKENYYDLEVPDILNGVNYVIEKGYIDTDKLAIMGWSNGSILAIQCCIEDNRFKALLAGAGDVNWTSDYGNCAFGAAFDNAYFGGPPWDNPEYYIKKSPLFQMKKIITPTIIFFGTNDTNVPTEQGWEHFRAMQQIGKAPVRFLLFPGQPHGLRKMSYQKRKIDEELAWLDKYVLDKDKKENEAFKKDSPLAYELKKTKIKKTGNIYGEKYNGKIIPETVEVDSLFMGRFEITRKQYKEYKTDYKYESGTCNYPVNNITFEEAKKYCEWLSSLTGRNYRLPLEAELQKLIKQAKNNAKNENNLDYWAGYSPSPDEIKLLKEKLTEIEKTKLLLKEVGSFIPIKDCIYDLAGNAAEWCTTEENKGKIIGLSAVTPVDDKLEYQAPEQKYVGFRVLLEKTK